ncbi:siroheme synthase [Microbulbifer aestuariivivens]|uniref:uroporphyrinogen-III C-methyltransferase n=1 Tax=Microbulbifer aestuariivivens TaxID=1908308 RepID=A0ABP9WSE3_9GAMM
MPKSITVAKCEVGFFKPNATFGYLILRSMVLSWLSAVFRRSNSLSYFLARNSERIGSTGGLTLGRSSPQGRVDLVGAGPGDPELLTRRAWNLLHQCDAVVYDALVSAELMASLPSRIERHYVGKRCGQHSVTQDEIGKLLCDLAQQGKHVVRLKGGDPLMFGRLGEELDQLIEAAIAYSVVPGIGAASGCAASVAMPLTERGLAKGLRLITASLSEAEEQLNWSDLAQEEETLVFYMGLSKASTISLKLIDAGLPANFPVLIVENGTQRQQRNISTTLQGLPVTVNTFKIQAPALIYVGKIVGKLSQRQGCLIGPGMAMT